MRSHEWFRAAAAAGIVSMVFDQVGFGLLSAANGNFPMAGAPTEQIAARFASALPTQALIGIDLEVLGSVLFLVFVVCVWAKLRVAEADPAWMSAASLIAGAMSQVAFVGAIAPERAIYSRAGNGLESAEAAMLADLNTALFGLGAAFVALYLLATGIAIVRTRALPRWLGWSALVLVPFLLAAGLLSRPGPAFLAFLLFPLWVVAASVFLLLRPVGDEAAVAPT